MTTFHGQRSDEVVIFSTRRHWSLLFGQLLRWFFLALLPIVARIVIGFVNDTFSFDTSSSLGVILTLGASAYVLIILLLAYQAWVDYELDALTLTNERVLRVEQDGMFHRTISQLTLDRIQDVTIETKGVLSTAFGYGNITIESAGEQENFIFKSIPNVEAVQTQLLQYAKHAPRMGVEREPTASPKPPTGKPE